MSANIAGIPLNGDTIYLKILYTTNIIRILTQVLNGHLINLFLRLLFFKLGVSLNINFFASRLIIFRYSCMHVSFNPDPGAIAINAFHMSWKPYLSYVFRPFCLISRILQKIQKEKATVIAAVPHWPTQIWWPQMIGLLIRHPMILPNTKTTVYLPSNLDLIHLLFLDSVYLFVSCLAISPRSGNFNCIFRYYRPCVAARDN